MIASTLDLDAIAACADHGRSDREIASDALVHIPALIAAIRERDKEIAHLNILLDYESNRGDRLSQKLQTLTFK